MKLGFRLALLCWVLVCLLLSLTQAIGLSHPLPVVGSGPWFDRGGECASDWPTASVVRSMEFDPVHPGSLASVVLDCTGTAGNLAPPGLETHGPPKPIEPRQVAGQASSSKQRHRATFSSKLLAFNRRITELRFCDSL